MTWPFFKRKESSLPLSQLPKESYLGLHFEADGSPDVWLVNTALIAFAERAEFSWQLSIFIEMEDVLEIGLPSKAEQKVLGTLSTELGERLKKGDNALFVGSGSFKGMREVLFQIRDPEVAHQLLTAFVGGPEATRAMEYRMQQDPEWKRASIYLEAAQATGQ